MCEEKKSSLQHKQIYTLKYGEFNEYYLMENQRSVQNCFIFLYLTRISNYI